MSSVKFDACDEYFFDRYTVLDPQEVDRDVCFALFCALFRKRVEVDDSSVLGSYLVYLRRFPEYTELRKFVMKKDGPAYEAAVILARDFVSSVERLDIVTYKALVTAMQAAQRYRDAEGVVVVQHLNASFDDKVRYVRALLEANK